MATYTVVESQLARRWYVLDVADQPLGRVASRIASVLRGKHRPEFSPHADAGDFVVVVNADKMRLTGSKLDQKLYYTHSGRPGGMTTETAARLLARRPGAVIERAVRGMLPKGSLGRRMGRKLKVYAGPVHPHAAQKPEPFTF
ncbi:MAG: 50S ribosomal protein L13 [Myxococcales bacterium]|nr:50S ribosomal protein L13 [Myxococcales bacterium]